MGRTIANVPAAAPSGVIFQDWEASARCSADVSCELTVFVTLPLRSWRATFSRLVRSILLLLL